MKRIMQLALVCVMVLSVVTLAVAQQVPQQVIRLGDWVEMGSEAFMNLIGTADLRYRTVRNYDFEDDIRDRVQSRDPFSTAVQSQELDGFWVQAQFGVDFMYQKNLKARILFRYESILDGNLIDNRENDANPGGTDVFGRAASNEGEGTNLERIWIDYTFPAPVEWLRMFVGAEVISPDAAGLLSDDDPRFALYATFGPKKEFQLSAAAVIQSESSRIGLTNDNDFIYYTFGAAYEFKPHRVSLDVAYFRERFNGAPLAVTTRLGEEHDTWLIMPSWEGTIGPVYGLLQFNVVVGKAEGTEVPGPQREFDVFGWGLVAYGEARLGVVSPFLGFVYGSGDDDATDTDLNGFMTLPQREITILASGRLSHFDRTVSFGSRDLPCPARSANTVFGGAECYHTVGNPFNDRVGNTRHAGINSTYSNPGLILPFGGLHIDPIKGHRVTLIYLYRAMVDTQLVEDALGVSVDEHQYHEVHGQWLWTLSRHFDIRLAGGVVIAGNGAEDIAQTVSACGPTRSNPCQAEDVALYGEARFRVTF
jgi:hypothetical protein